MKTTPAGSTAPAGTDIKYERTTSPSVSVSQPVASTRALAVKESAHFDFDVFDSVLQRCASLRATTTECVLLQTAATVRRDTQDQDAQVLDWALPELVQTVESFQFSV